jgi:superoxide dismutase, Fe-Mn family
MNPTVSKPMNATLIDTQNTRIIDVRRVPAFEQATTMLANATWRDPAKVQAWAQELAAGQSVLVYCVHGHEVSQNTALALQARGVAASYLAGGIEGWAAAGKPLVPKG